MLVVKLLAASFSLRAQQCGATAQQNTLRDVHEMEQRCQVGAQCRPAVRTLTSLEPKRKAQCLQAASPSTSH